MAVVDIHAEIGTTPIWGIPFSDANILRSMQKYGVERSIVSSTLGNSCDFRRGNMIIARTIAQNPSLMGCLTLNVNYPELSQKDMHSYLGQDNFAGILITSGSRTKHTTLAECEEILNSYRRFLKPVFLHTFDRPSVIAANEIAKAFPAMKFVLISMGGEDWRIASILADRTLNMYLEVSGSFSPDKIKFAVDRIGSHRVVYGSGLPYVDPSTILSLIKDADITEEDRRNIFENSARRLFGWERPRRTSVQTP